MAVKNPIITRPIWFNQHYLTMSKLTKPEAPKKPLTVYFKFRQDVWDTIQGDKKNSQLKELWDNMDPKKK